MLANGRGGRAAGVGPASARDDAEREPAPARHRLVEKPERIREGRAARLGPEQPDARRAPGERNERVGSEPHPADARRILEARSEERRVGKECRL